MITDYVSVESSLDFFFGKKKQKERNESSTEDHIVNAQTHALDPASQWSFVPRTPSPVSRIRGDFLCRAELPWRLPANWDSDRSGVTKIKFLKNWSQDFLSL